MCVCRRGRYGEGWGSGMDETSWVWSGYQWGLSSSKAVSNCIRICSNQKPQQELSILLTSTSDLGGLHEKSSFFDISENILTQERGASCFVAKERRRSSTSLIWTGTMWPHGLIGFFGLKVCLANINRLFMQQSHGNGHQHSCGFITYLITDSRTVKISPEHVRSIRSISNSLISTDINWTFTISTSPTNAECKTGELLPSKQYATDPDSSHEKCFFFVCVCTRMFIFGSCVLTLVCVVFFCQCVYVIVADETPTVTDCRFCFFQQLCNFYIHSITCLVFCQMKRNPGIWIRHIT